MPNKPPVVSNRFSNYNQHNADHNSYHASYGRFHANVFVVLQPARHDTMFLNDCFTFQAE
jgi:hypothetical protein